VTSPPSPTERARSGAGHPLADRSVQALLVVFFCSGLSMGYFSPLLSALMKEGGHSDLAVGLLGTTYYACVAVGALWAAGRRLSVPRALVSGLSVAGALSAILPLAPGIVGIAAARAGCGLAVGVYSTVAQAALLARTTERNRALVTGVQALAFAAGLGAGPLVGAAIYGRSALAAFLSGGALLVLAGAAISARTSPEWRGGEAPPRSAAGRAVFPLAGAFVYGFAEAALLSVYPLSLLERKLPVGAMGLSCSAFVLGGVVSTLPVSLAADRLGRGRVLLACAGCGLAAMAALTRVEAPASLIALSFAVGASLGPLFALALALVRDRLSEEDLAWGTAGFMTTFNLGCIAGPLVSSFAMTRLGPSGVFAPTLALLAVLVLQGIASGAAWTPTSGVATAEVRDGHDL
jgi:MFS family permease